MAAVIVLGCFRSGTSAIAGVLHNLGVFMGDQFDPPNDTNPRGYFEDLEFKNHLRDTVAENHGLESQIKALIVKREQDHPVWGFKYPEATIMMPWIDRLFSEVFIRYSLIVLDRDRDETCASMTKAMHKEDWRKLVDYYYGKRDAFLGQYQGRVLQLKFPDFLADPAATVATVANFVGKPVTEAAVKHITWHE